LSNFLNLLSICSFGRNFHAIKHHNIEGIHIQSLCFGEVVFVVMPLPSKLACDFLRKPFGIA
jgi:hypothetical protein